MKPGRVYRLVIRLTGDGPHVSEVDEYALRICDVLAAFDNDFEPLFPVSLAENPLLNRPDR
jgi:hypothetical protein